MGFNFLANLMSGFKWKKTLPHSEVVILHRGAPDDRKRINGDQITEIKKDHFSYINFETKEEVYIPMHRVLEIWMGKELVWKKRQSKSKQKVSTKQLENALKTIMDETMNKASTVKKVKKSKGKTKSRKKKAKTSRKPAGKPKKEKKVKKTRGRKSSRRR